VIINNYRQKYFLKTLMQILKINNLKDVNHKELYRIITLIKWLRFVINGQIYFAEIGKSYKSNFMIPFAEGPLVNYFQDNHVDLKETLIIKPYQQKIIKKILGFNFLYKQISLRLSVYFTKKYRLSLTQDKNINHDVNNSYIIDNLITKERGKLKNASLKKINSKKFNLIQKIRYLNLILFFKNLYKN